MSESKQNFVERLTQVLSQAENVGESKARKIARRTSEETQDMEEALRLIANDKRFQESLNNIQGVGATTLSNVIDLAGEIVGGGLTIIKDTFNALRVVKEDYLNVKSGEVPDPEKSNQNKKAGEEI